MHKKHHLSRQAISPRFVVYEDGLVIPAVHRASGDVWSFCKGRGQRLAFILEPRNRAGTTAIKVLGSWRGVLFNRKNVDLGYLPGETAAALWDVNLAHMVEPRLIKTYLGADGHTDIWYQIMGPREFHDAFRSSRDRQQLVQQVELSAA